EESFAERVLSSKFQSFKVSKSPTPRSLCRSRCFAPSGLVTLPPRLTPWAISFAASRLGSPVLLHFLKPKVAVNTLQRAFEALKPAFSTPSAMLLRSLPSAGPPHSSLDHRCQTRRCLQPEFRLRRELRR